MLYSKNFDASKFKQQPLREFNRTKDDPCYIQQHTNDNAKRLKFITTNHADLLGAKESMNFFGMTMQDQLFVPSEKMDTFSNFRNGQNGNILTNPNIKASFGQLPLPTLPSRYQLSHGNVDTEDSFRNILESNRKSCNPSDVTFHNRHFSIFDDTAGIETPKAIESIETPEFGPRGGVSTRFNAKK